ncbi:MAG TPA: ABC transporter ATP-binding protein [Firmicutes bacterium]|nr:ABC transporter ATP-binding protein [Bacillota bacterium]
MGESVRFRQGKLYGDFGLIFKFIRRNRRTYIGGIASLLLVDTLQLIQPRILGRMADDYKAGILTRSGILRYIAIILGMALAIAIGRFFWRQLIMGAARRLEFDLRGELFRHFERLPASYYDQHKIGDLMAHATNDIHAVRMAAAQGVVLSVDSTFLAASTVVIMLKTVDARLTVLALLPLPALAMTTAFLGRAIHTRFKGVQDAFAKLTDRVQENLSGIRVVKSFLQEKAEIERFQEANQSNLAANVRLVRLWGAFGPLIQMLSGLSFVIVLGYGGSLAIRGDISLGDFVAFTGYLGLLTWPVMAIGWVVNILQRGAASLDRINAILRVKPEIVDHENPAPVSSIDGHIEFRHLTFTYPGREKPALEDINLVVEKGKTLAIVGRSGSGKTTLANLIVRLYDPGPGQLFVDGHDITRIPLKVLRRAIGYVPQDNFLFSTSIRKNIEFAREDLSGRAVMEAVETAQLAGDLEGLPDGLDTVIGERGVTLSGGQRQRACIARAIVKDPAILILDDCLSAVDTSTEDRILRGLRQIMRGRTSIMISHRLSTVKEADEIVVLDEGRIVERGNHEALMAMGGLYHDMYQRQLLEEELAVVD